MPEPDWKLELRRTIGAQADPWVEYDWQEEALLNAVLPHIEAAYQRGLMAGRSQANYPTRRKKKEDPCTASADAPTPASPTEAVGEPPEGSAP